MSATETTPQDSQPTDICKDMCNIVTDIIRTEIATTAENAYKTLGDKITADVRRQVSNQVMEKLRGRTMFVSELTKKYQGGDSFPDEYIVAEWDPLWGNIITNYGRIIFGGKTRHAPGLKMTNEVIQYVQAVYKGNSYTDLTIHVEKLITAYNDRYAFASNSVHATEIEGIRTEIKQELADEFARLSDEKSALKIIAENNFQQLQLNETQADLLKTERDELNADIARESAHRRSEHEIAKVEKQLELVKRQLNREAKRVEEGRGWNKAEARRLEKLRNKLSNKALLLDTTLESLESDEDFSE